MTQLPGAHLKHQLRAFSSFLLRVVSRLTLVDSCIRELPRNDQSKLTPAHLLDFDVPFQERLRRSVIWLCGV